MNTTFNKFLIIIAFAATATTKTWSMEGEVIDVVKDLGGSQDLLTKQLILDNPQQALPLLISLNKELQNQHTQRNFAIFENVKFQTQIAEFKILFGINDFLRDDLDDVFKADIEKLKQELYLKNSPIIASLLYESIANQLLEIAQVLHDLFNLHHIERLHASTY